VAVGAGMELGGELDELLGGTCESGCV
jgi:hypothetical protein